MLIKNLLFKKQIPLIILGNTLEWFDFGLFLYMAPIIGAQFFPQQTPLLATLNALMIFALGFIFRPLGGILFGHYGDTIGRTKVLRFSLLLMSLSTLSIGLLPSYHSIGILAPILLLLFRMLQGLSVGGEFSGALIYLIETAASTKRGFISSFTLLGANLGFLFATITYFLLKTCSDEQLITVWAWRCPFLIAGFVSLIFSYFRFTRHETPAFTHLQKTHHVPLQPFKTVLIQAPVQLVKIAGLTCMSASYYYFFFGYMPIYLTQFLNFSMHTALILQSVLLLGVLVFIPFASKLGDYYSRKKMIILCAIANMLFIIPFFYLLQSHSFTIMILMLSIMVIISSIDQGNTLIAAVENCPANVRYSGMAFSYNLGNALFGGTAPIIISVLKDFGQLAPAYYLGLMAMTTFITSITLLPQNQSFGPLGTVSEMKPQFSTLLLENES